MYNPHEEIINRLDNIESMLMEIKRHISLQVPNNTQQPLIKGIHELAAFLKVSPARAQKLKNEGVFEYFQDGRTLLFDPNKVLDAMSRQQR